VTSQYRVCNLSIQPSVIRCFLGSSMILSPRTACQAQQITALRSGNGIFNFSPFKAILAPHRFGAQFKRTMSDLSIQLTAPNGVKYTQPNGLFINNEWVKSSDGGMITSINPTYVKPNMTAVSSLQITESTTQVMNPRLHLSTQPQQMMLTKPLPQHEQLSSIPAGETCLELTGAS
jgi:hypothetical protein